MTMKEVVALGKEKAMLNRRFIELNDNFILSLTKKQRKMIKERSQLWEMIQVYSEEVDKKWKELEPSERCFDIAGIK